MHWFSRRPATISRPSHGQAARFRPGNGVEPSRKLLTLEALRGAAALLVVMYHLQDVLVRRVGLWPFGGLFGAGDRGVDLFFVLSGFIITISHRSDIGMPRRVAPYLYKRACRVLPSVWILTVLAALAYGLGLGTPDKAIKLESWRVTASLLLLPQDQPALVNVTWTLTYEAFFYGVFAILIANRRLGLAVIVFWQSAVLLAAAGAIVPSSWLASYYLRPISLEFGIGVVCAVILMRAPSGFLKQRCVRNGLLVLGTVMFAGAVLYEGLRHEHALEPLRVVFYGVGPGLLIIGLATRERDLALRVPAVLLWLGDASYAIYLVNFSVITLAVAVMLRFAPASMGYPALLLCVVAAVGAGGAFNGCVDRPIQKRLRRLRQYLFETVSNRRSSRAGLDGKLSSQ